ncbi:hypothetical protein PIB30_064314 [Stylosanthes scabra]|uniref:Ubiquitin-like protease family profile domain-containing protein n=1 Tax=Stylosanthes scabra TaxID=79078 RepID=A0ABU6RMK0_9FABA|nr:hypothetical protein [Stylosanthes scabra]
MIIYFKERYDDKSLNDPNGTAPWIQRWSGDLLKEKTKAEDEDITVRIDSESQNGGSKTEIRKKGAVRKEKNPEDDSEIIESNTEGDSEEEEYHTTDSEIESDTEEVQQERKSKTKEEESVIHQRQIQEREERSRRREKGKEDKEPTLAKEIEQIKKRKLQRKEEAKKKKKTATKEGHANPPPHMDIPIHDATIPEPDPQPEPKLVMQPEPEPVMQPEDQPAPGLMMVASVATQAEEENPVTPAVQLQTVVPDRPAAAEETHISSDLKERCVVWALSNKKEIKYDSIFMVNGEWHYEVVRKQFRSMRSGKEIDATIFAPVLYSGHWWMYVLDKLKKTFFVVDSRRKDNPSHDRTRLNKFAGTMIDQLLVYAGYYSLLTKGIRSKPPQISWFPRYIPIHEQPNAYGCETFVMKWMEVLDPTKLDAHSKYPIDDWSTLSRILIHVLA